MDHIQTERLLLRHVRADDVYNVNAYAGDKDITMMMFYPHLNLDETREYIAKSLDEYAADPPGNIEYLIEYEGKVVGEVDIDFSFGDSAELGWLLDKRYRHLGIATEAAKALIAEGCKLGFKRFFARCDANNPASENVMKRLNMTLCAEGTRIYPKTGKTAPEKTYELIVK